MSLFRKKQQPLIIDAEETFQQKAQRYQREIEATSQRIQAEVELKTQMIVDQVKEDSARRRKGN